MEPARIAAADLHVTHGAGARAELNIPARPEGSPTNANAVRPALMPTTYPRVVGAAARHFASVSLARWDLALRFVRRVQERALLRIVEHAKHTEVGRAWGFSSIRSYEDYVRRVPLGDYDSFSPYIQRMLAGESHVLVPESVRYFGNSSGSSSHGRAKFLPITDRQIRLQQASGADAVMRYLHWSADSDFFCGFTLGLFPSTVMRPQGPALITSNPALMMTKMPFITRPVYLPEDDVKTLSNYDEKLAVIAARYLDYDVRAVAGTTCWFSLLFEKVLAAARSRGRRARTVSDVWPNLGVLFGGGVSAAPYVPILRDMIGHDRVALVDTYNATEGGVYAMSDFTDRPGLLMLPHRGTFFEFVPMEERENPSPTRVPLWAVEPHRPYSLVVTTVSGLYAYELGDIVRFPSVRPPRIEFMGRLSGCLSLTQELTTHVEIEHAVAHAVSVCPSRPVDFGAAADVGVEGTAKSRYLLFVEFREGAAPANLGAFARGFDEGLCKENRVYREHREGNVALLPPRVVLLARGGARAFLEEITNGNVQGKFPRVVDETRKTLLWKHTAAGC
ncbi:MAG: GH3 auxin-responsive promoter family protein [Polyangiaceae bacterium]